MKKDGKNYPIEAIQLLTELLNEKKEASKILVAAGYSELALIYDAAEGKTGITELLMKKGYVVIAGFLTAILTENRSPISFLLKNGAEHWAATANYILKDKKANTSRAEGYYEYY